jgi:hypothetical protein
VCCRCLIDDAIPRCGLDDFEKTTSFFSNFTIARIILEMREIATIFIYSAFNGSNSKNTFTS